MRVNTGLQHGRLQTFINVGHMPDVDVPHRTTEGWSDEHDDDAEECEEPHD